MFAVNNFDQRAEPGVNKQPLVHGCTDRSPRSRLLLLLVLCTLPFSHAVLSQEVEEVVIEAEQIEEQLLDDLASVSALDAEKLADAGIENVEDVAAYVPNLTLTQTETGTNIFIRGIGSGVNQGFDQSVGLFSDGVPLPRSNMARAPFLDLASVQVKRGPQYVLDGNYAIAGAVHMISNLATDEFKSSIDFNYTPSQDDKTLLMTIGGPINDIWAANLVFQQKQSDGYMENVFKDRNDTIQDEKLARLVLGFTPTDSLSFKLKAEIGQFDSDGRNAERILDLPTPNAAITAVGDLGPATRDGADVDVAWAWITEADFLFTTRNVLWDIGSNGFNPSPFLAAPQEQFWASGRSYSGKLAEIYDAVGIARPDGLTDTSFNFKRASDGEETSSNDSLNLTLVSELWLGEHKFTLTNSYIDYAFEEVLDLDFAPVPFLGGEQAEEYSQFFNSLNYRSPEGAFVEFQAGLWYMEAELEFDAITRILYTDRGDFPVIAPLDTVQQQQLTGFFEDPVLRTKPDIARGYLGSRNTGPVLVQGTSGMLTDRIFEQDQTLFAAYAQAKINWTEKFRSTFGLRYTHSEKEATRDLSLIYNDGTFPVFDDITDPIRGNILANGIGQNGLLFGVQHHSCRAGDISSAGSKTSDQCITGKRREERLLPSLTLEFDINDSLSILAAARMAGKLGGFDARANTRPDVRAGLGLVAGTFEFRDEKAIVYEVGTKWFLPNGLGQLSATAFYTDYTDLQLSRSDGKTGSLVDNAGGANSRGVEAEGLIQFTDRFSMTLSLAWTEFEFTDFLFGACHFGRRPDNFFVTDSQSQISFDEGTFDPIIDNNVFWDLEGNNLSPGFLPIEYNAFRRQRANSASGDSAFEIYFLSSFEPANLPVNPISQDYPNGQGADAWENRSLLPSFCDFKGQTNQFVSDWQGTFSFNYENEVIGLGIFKPTLDVLYNSGYHTTSTQDPLAYQDEYFQFNGRLELSSFEDTWTVAITGQNLTDEKIVSYATNTPLGSGLQGARGFVAFVRPPRSIGINVRYNFY